MSQLSQYEVDPVFGCHLWTGKRDRRDGRALVWRGNKPFGAYLAVWQAANGPLPAGRVADHTCRRPWCVRLAHLEAVTKDENEKRKSWSYRCRMKKCARGHSLDDAMVTPQGGRICRTCNQEDQGT